MAEFNKYFSVLALFILFRETIEASIICSVLLQFLHRSKPGLKKAVWWGVAGGVGVSIIFGVVFIVIYYKAQQSLFQGKNRDWFKGIISWIAALLITILGFAMLRFLGWEAKWKRKLTTALKEKVAEAEAEKLKAAKEGTEPASSSGELPSPVDAAPSSTPDGRKGSSESESATSPPSGEKQALSLDSADKHAVAADAVAAATDGCCDDKKSDTKDSDMDAKTRDATLASMMPPDEAEPIDLTPPTRKESLKIWLLVFTTVVREGIESVVFLGGLGNVPLTAVPLPAVVGIICGVLVGVFLYYSGKQVKHIMWLVIIMAIIIFFIAAGQVNIGTDALMKAGAFGTYSVWYDERPWYMLPMYDWSACCADTDPTGNEPTDQQNRQRFFALVRAIFGYQDKATPLEVMLYCSYWSITFALAAWKSWRGTLFDADYKYKRQQRKAAKEARQRAAEAAAIAAADADLKTSSVVMLVAEGEGHGADGQLGAGTGTMPAAVDKSAVQVQA